MPSRPDARRIKNPKTRKKAATRDMRKQQAMRKTKKQVKKRTARRS